MTFSGFRYGIVLRSVGNTIRGDGLRIESGTGNCVLDNTIYNVGRRPIDLGADGDTPNDPLDTDLGANGL